MHSIFRFALGGALVAALSAGAAWADGERLSVAKRHFERTQTLFNNNGASEEELDQAELQAKESQHTYQQDQLILNALIAAQVATDLLPKTIQEQIDNKIEQH